MTGKKSHSKEKSGSREEKRNKGKNNGKTNKLVATIPNKYRNERFGCLNIDRDHVTVKEDLNFSIVFRKTESFSTFKKLEKTFNSFVHQFYRNQMPSPYSVFLYRPPNQNNYYLYFCYKFVDEVTMFDKFEAKQYYLKFVNDQPRANMTLAHLSVALIWRNEFRRRCWALQMNNTILKNAFDGYCRPVLHSDRFLYFKVEKTAVPIIGHLLLNNVGNILKSLRNKYLLIDYKLKDSMDTMKNDALKFFERNNEWVKCRRTSSLKPLYLIMRIHQLNDYLNHMDTDVEELKTRTELDLFNELNYFSSHLAYSVHFCRAVKDFKFTMVDDKFFIKKEGNVESAQMLRVSLTRYSCYPASSVVRFNTSGHMVPATERFPDYPPSVDSISGYSTDSAASTATDTPLDWAFNWKMQDNDFDHRFAKSGTFNFYDVKAEADRFFEKRLIRIMNTRKEKILRLEKLKIISEESDIFNEENVLRPPRINVLMRTRELHKVKKILGAKTLNAECEQILTKRYENLLQTFPQDSTAPIHLSEGWKRLSLSVDEASLQNIGVFLRNNCQWVETSPYSMVDKVTRADRMPTHNLGDENRNIISFVMFFMLWAMASLISLL